MKILKPFILILSVILFFSCVQKHEKKEIALAHFVNPFIGTNYVGNTYPGAQVPFGMVQLSPDNGLPGWDRIAGYFYPDSTIAGFSHTHLSGTGAGDLYDISFMPVRFPERSADKPLGVHSRFSHSKEEAHAGYYKVHLDDYNIDVELTAGLRTGVQRYTFKSGGASAIRLNLSKSMNWDKTLDASIKAIDQQKLSGLRHSDGWARNQTLFFATRISTPWDRIEIDTVQLDNGKVAMDAILYYDTLKPGEQIEVYTALSAVDSQHAFDNLYADINRAKAQSFDAFLSHAEDQWNQELQKIQIETEDVNQKVTFYTALYHSMLAPVVYDDEDGSYRGPDKKIYSLSAANKHHYSRFSLWDTYRAAQPLYTLICPNRVGDMVQSFIDFQHQHGRIPVWNMQASETDMMIGYHSAPVIADAILKGISGFDYTAALDACTTTANDDDYRGIGAYKKFGYLPCDIEHESLSKTLEYAYDDATIARIAQKLNKNDVAEVFAQRGQSYRAIFNKSNGFFQPKDTKGQFKTPFNPREYTTDITESNAWQYLWSVQQDVDGLVELIGGPEAFEKKLDAFFNATVADHEDLPLFSTGMIGQYAHGNEPSHHVAYLYNKTAHPNKGRKLIRQVMNQFYTNTPEGLCGNEDCGQMSAWYVFSAMGFYPVDPASGVYELGIPLCKKLSLNLPNGKQFVVRVDGDLNSTNVQKIQLNGVTLHGTTISHQQILAGGELVFFMTEEPIKSPKYESYKRKGDVIIDGKLDDPDWQKSAWSDLFVDIQGDKKPKPKYNTRFKMLWDEDAVYVAAKLEEPHIWSTIAKRDSTIYWDNDFEVFMDPDGDGCCYFEFEINAQNTPWDLLMTKPYYQGGTFLNDFDFKGLQHATNIQGTINDPSDTDKCWTVELRIPLKSVNEKIVPGTTWKMNFSRVEWLQVDVKNGKYIKRPGTEGFGNEENWVWAPTGIIDIHRPDKWGTVTFKN